MKDGEIGVVRASDTCGIDISTVETAPDNDVLLSPAPHPHFTIKEVRTLAYVYVYVCVLYV